MQYVYLLKSNQLFKIGITRKLESRIQNLKLSSPYAIEVVTAKKVKEPLKIEAMLLDKYHDKKTTNGSDWFTLTCEEAVEVCLEINRAEGERRNAKELKIEESLRNISEKQTKSLRVILENLSKLEKALRDKQYTTGEVKIKQSLDEENKRVQSTSDEELIEKAKQVVLMDRKGSASLLQRKLSIGYARAARILDKLHEQGIIGPANGSFARKVLVDGM